jgi:hypothetical protein
MTNSLTGWNTATLEEMEETAKGEADCFCSKKLGKYWLEVIVRNNGEFAYNWRGINVPRIVAERAFSQLPK